jgi:hypothetical protein
MQNNFVRAKLEQLAKRGKKRPCDNYEERDDLDHSADAGLITPQQQPILEDNDENRAPEPELIQFEEGTTIRGGRCLWHAGFYIFKRKKVGNALTYRTVLNHK